MRRTIHILLSFTLILATTGLSISKHYCESILIRTSLGTEAKSCMPDMDMESGCCDEQTETMILDDDFQVSQSEIKISPEFDLLVSYLVTEMLPVIKTAGFISIISSDTGPPPGTEPLYVRVQSFLL